MMKKIVTSLVSIGILGSFASIASGELVDRIVAVVNRKVITESQLQDAERQFAAQAGTTEQTQERRKNVLDMLIENELIRQKAEEADILVNDEELNAALYDIKQRNNLLSDEQLKQAILQEGNTWEEFLEDIREQIKLAKLVNREVRSQVDISEEEVELYYQTHQGEFDQAAPTVHIRHILLPLKENAGTGDVEAAQKLANNLVQQLRAGADFAEMAKQYSEHPSAQNGGELGTFKEGELAPPFDIAFTMEGGEISDPVRSDLGFHIIFVEEKTGGQQATFEKAKTLIRRKLFEQKSNALYQKWITKLKETAYIENNL
ncbi:PpiC-type peptidyl-prolyl cis-trans isomerase [Candidatus Vecturithrix granuli]|uniref:PpiC-type peptidyl-prolyl cis-trans isomerase n=1 Tax=Vecturithrix granuli TaxID=1499967 RepID=A0A081C452_VECG1|nr:PpiC-type peptidyl-prolyl cis-trans isomerase [Candidatus Vecturithrix granuli]